jgi:eukaryotic-like serine/threonine-protein kinase
MSHDKRQPSAADSGAKPASGDSASTRVLPGAHEVPSDAGPWPQPGQAVAGYRLIRLLGAGGMGQVFLARQEHPQREVALKLIHRGLAVPEVLARFALEAEALGRLRHQGIAQIYTAGTLQRPEGSVPYLVMEYVEGRPLREYAASVGLADRILLLATICDAVEHAHQRGVIHRDLKPGNILVTPGGLPKVLDFGVARIAGTDANTEHTPQLTRAGIMIGTLSYMSPEQTRTDRDEVDTRSDVYALGVLGYEMLSGRMPYPLPDDQHGIVSTIRETTPIALGKIVPSCRGDIETIIGKALEKPRDRRYPSAGAMADDLRRHLANEAILARPPTIGYRLSKFARRNPALTTSLALAALLAVAGVVGITTFAVREQAARQAAEREAARALATLDFVRSVLSQANPALAGSSDVSVREALRAASDMIAVSYAAQPDTEVELRTLLGNVLLSQGDFDAAGAELSHALALAERTLDVNDRRRLLAESQSAQALGLRGELTRAQALLAALIPRMEASLPADAIELLEARKALAQLRTELGDTEGLEAEVLAIGALVPARRDASTAQLRVDLDTLLAFLARTRGDLDAVVELRRQVAEVSRRDFGEDSLITMIAVDNLALALSEAGQREAAAELQRAQIEGFSARIGEQHPNTLRARNNLGSLLLALGELPEAREQLETARAGMAGIPASHDLHALLAMNLATVAFFEGRLDEAEALLQEAVERMLAERGELHPDSIQAMLSYAVLLHHRQRIEDARHWHRRTLDAVERRFGAQHAMSLQAASEFAAFLRDAGELDAALAAFADLLPRIEAAQGATAPQALITLYQYSGALQRAGRHAEALPLSARLLEHADAVLGESSPFALLAPNRHARSLVAGGRLDEAEALLRASWTRLEAAGVSPEWLSWLAETHAELEAARGDSAAEAEWRARATELAAAGID